MEIAGEMQIDFVHRGDLGIATPGRPAFYPEARAEAWLAQCDHRPCANAVQRIAQADRRRCLTFPCGRRANPCDQYQRTIGPLREAFQEIELKFRLKPAIRNQRVI